MRHKLLALSAIFFTAASCKDAAAPDAPKFRVTAVITDDNKCTVSAMDKTYSSSGQIRGDQPSQFIGTVADKSYHGFGCVVLTPGADGDIRVIFSGNNVGKPLRPGVYPLAQDIFDNTPLGMASVIFNSSDYGPFKLRTLNGSPGSVTVEETAGGGRRIIVDVETVQFGEPF